MRIAIRLAVVITALVLATRTTARAQPSNVAGKQIAKQDVPAEQPAIVVSSMGWPVSLAFSPDQRELTIVCTHGAALLDTASWTKARTFDVGFRMLAYSPDGKTMATAEGRDGARLWKATDSGRLVAQPPDAPWEINLLDKPSHVLLTPAQSNARKVLSTGFSSDSSLLLTTDSYGHMTIWNAKSGMREVDVPETLRASSATLHPNGKLIAFGDEHGVLHVWDRLKKTVVRDVATPSPITSLSYSRDGKRLATTHTGPSGKSVMLWDTGSWKAQVEPGYEIAAFSADGAKLAIGGRDVRVLAPATGELLRTITFPEPTRADFNPDPKLRDTTLCLALQALAWRPDGRQLAAACMNGVVQLISISK